MGVAGIYTKEISEGEMNKPTKEIERLRSFSKNTSSVFWARDAEAILAYLDSLKDWPADLDFKRMMELAADINTRGSIGARTDALRRLAELAPKREKRKVEIWQHKNGGLHVIEPYQALQVGVWTKRGEAEIDA